MRPRQDRAPARRMRWSPTSAAMCRCRARCRCRRRSTSEHGGRSILCRSPDPIEEAVMTDQGLRTQVLDACHGLAASGMGDTVGGHVSARVPGEQLYWTNVLDLSFEELTEDDLLLLDFEGNVVDGN